MSRRSISASSSPSDDVDGSDSRNQSILSSINPTPTASNTAPNGKIKSALKHVQLPSPLPSLTPAATAPPASSSSSSSQPHLTIPSVPSNLSLSPVSPSLRSLWLQAKSEANSGRAYWTEEQYVEDITVSFLYQPHTVIALSCIIGYMIYVAFYQVNNESSLIDSLRVGTGVAAIFICILGMLAFPSGPFVRPHPILWRLAFSVAVLYEIVLIILLYLSKSNARLALTFFYPGLNVPLKERSYAENCAFTYDNLYEGFVDPYALSHFIGWVIKSLILRDVVLCWVISVQWELIEIVFTHWLPNFAECWWDQWLLDVLICNGLGIYVGHLLCNYLEMKEYHWRGFMHIPTWSGRIHRAMLQFTPQSWTKVRWEKTKNLKLFFFVQFLIFCFHWEEMNAFFLKHLLWIPPPCALNVIRLAIWAFVGVPSLRQVYTYMTDPQCKKIGMQTFLAVLILVTESLVIIKMSPGEFSGKHMKPRVQLMCWCLFVIWILWNVYYVRKIYKQEKKSFFAEGEKLQERFRAVEEEENSAVGNSMNGNEAVAGKNRQAQEEEEQEEEQVQQRPMQRVLRRKQ